MQTLREKLLDDPRFVESEEPVAFVIVGARPWPTEKRMAMARALRAKVREVREAMLALLRSLPTKGTSIN